jgi:hypothetical protein
MAGPDSRLVQRRNAILMPAVPNSGRSPVGVSTVKFVLDLPVLRPNLESSFLISFPRCRIISFWYTPSYNCTDYSLLDLLASSEPGSFDTSSKRYPICRRLRPNFVRDTMSVLLCVRLPKRPRFRNQPILNLLRSPISLLLVRSRRQLRGSILSSTLPRLIISVSQTTKRIS